MAVDKVLSENQKFSAISEPIKEKKDLSKDLNSLSKIQTECSLWIAVNEPIITAIHDAISVQWKANKDRSLATVESAIRGIGKDIERLSIAVPKLGSDKVSDNSGSKFTKPR